MSERRQFERFTITEDAIAYDEGGRELGRVVHAGGGGMGIKLVVSDQFAPGERLRVCVVEPRLEIRNVIDVIIRYVREGMLGVEFVSGKPL